MPGDATLVNRAEIHHDLGHHGLARRDVEHGLSLAPDNARVLCTRGLLELAAGRQEAAEDFTHALQLGADNEEDILARTAVCHRALSEQDC